MSTSAVSDRLWPVAVVGRLHPEADLRAMHVQLVFRLLESANPF